MNDDRRAVILAGGRGSRLDAIGAVGVSVSLAACATTFPFIPDHYTFSRGDVQKAVARKFPYQKTVAQVVDVSLVYEGNEVWLAQQQQRDFLAALDRNRGDIRALIREINTMTSQMRSRILARN